jgi:hypothetical protein
MIVVERAAEIILECRICQIDEESSEVMAAMVQAGEELGRRCMSIVDTATDEEWQEMVEYLVEIVEGELEGAE